MQLVRRDDLRVRVLELPPELVANHVDGHRVGGRRSLRAEDDWQRDRQNERDDDHSRERLRLGIAGKARERGPEFSPIDGNHGEDGAELDDDGEDVPACVVELQQLFGNQQMAGRRDRQEFGQPLDDAENDRRPDVVHALKVPAIRVA